MDTVVQPGDVLLIHIQDEPAFFARVEEIHPDIKPGWRQLRFTVLVLPVQEMTWTLEPVQVDGEPFTMGGTPMRIERLPAPGSLRPTAQPDSCSAAEDVAIPQEGAEVISFPGRKKKAPPHP